MAGGWALINFIKRCLMNDWQSIKLSFPDSVIFRVKAPFCTRNYCSTPIQRKTARNQLLISFQFKSQCLNHRHRYGVVMIVGQIFVTFPSWIVRHYSHPFNYYLLVNKGILFLTSHLNVTFSTLRQHLVHYHINTCTKIISSPPPCDCCRYQAATIVALPP